MNAFFASFTALVSAGITAGIASVIFGASHLVGGKTNRTGAVATFVVFVLFYTVISQSLLKPINTEVTTNDGNRLVVTKRTITQRLIPLWVIVVPVVIIYSYSLLGIGSR